MMTRRWEIWLARVAFGDKPTIQKVRPVLIVSPNEAFILSLKITSHEPRKYCEGEYVIIKWKEAGLHKTSTVGCAKQLKLNEDDLLKRIGRLHPVDIVEIRRELRKLYM